jgi:hypothetical protein
MSAMCRTTFFIRGLLRSSIAVLLLAGLGPATAQFVTTAPPSRNGAPSPASGFVEDHFVAYSVSTQSSNAPATFINKSRPVAKGITIDLGHGALVTFDTDLLAYAAGWRGSNELFRTMIVSSRGNGPAIARGIQLFGSASHPGFSLDGNFSDPRPGSAGPLPLSSGRYGGLYRDGDKTVLSYTIGSAEVLDLPEFDPATETFTRTLAIGPLPHAIELAVTEILPDSGLTLASLHEGKSLIFHGASKSLFLGAVQESSDEARLAFVNGRVMARIPASKSKTLLQLLIGVGEASLEDFAKRTASGTAIPDPARHTRGGPARWGRELTTTGSLGSGSGAYVVDTVGLPETNPWHSWMRVSGFDFFPDGRAAVSTLSGDVWIVSGLDRDLKEVHWRRFATGLYEPLGVKIVHDAIYVLGRDQITILHDLNHDGEADFYECFNNGGVVSPIYHAYNMDLQTDSQGNFYYVVDGNLVDPDLPMHGCMLRVSKNGRSISVFSTGLRAANGMSVGPNDEITSADNQGHWTPVCRINLMKQGGFYGYKGDPRETKPTTRIRFPDTYDNPLCWIPYPVDNSSGGQVWVPDNRFGPLKGRLLHTSYGKCTLFSVLTEKEGETWQGGVWQFPLQFASGIMRARFNPKDGQLFVGGMKGWQTSAAKDGAFQRVRYTGKPVEMPLELHVYQNGVELVFSEAVKAQSGRDPQNYSAQIWNYRWTKTYGSDEYSVANPEAKGHDTLEVTAARVSKSGRSVFLTIPGLRPVMQLGIKYNLETASGRPLNQKIDSTINFLRAGSPKLE